MIENENIPIPVEYQDICPIPDKDFQTAMTILVQEPGFQNIVSMALPNYKYSEFKHVLLGINSKHEFQVKVMKPFLEGLMAKTGTSLTTSGTENLDKEMPYTFVTNHRDIVLDSAQLSYLLIKGGRDACEIAIGNNLLIYDWITKLVRMNKSFIVKRNLGRIQTLTAAVQLSGYMHFAVEQKRASLWIAQREGRCKDSNDRTQESLVKMLAYGNRDKSFIESLKELTIGHKGEVHYAFTPCINEELDNIPEGLDKFLEVDRVCAIIDHAIHQNYKIFKTNYIAHDILFDDKHFADKYTQEEREAFEHYLSSQIDKTEGIKLSEADRFYMYNKMLQMYSNPLSNYLEATK